MSKAILPPTPGQVLRNFLDEHGITQDRFAEALGVSRFSINQIVNDRRTITAEMALRLGRTLSTTPEFWLNLQRGLDLHVARVRLRDEIQAIPVFRKARSDDQLFYDVTGDVV